MAERTCTYEEFEQAWNALNEQVRFKLVSYKLDMFSIQLTEEPRFTRRQAGTVTVNWAGCGSHTPSEARTFAIALAEVADLADRFEYNGYRIGE